MRLGKARIMNSYTVGWADISAFNMGLKRGRDTGQCELEGNKMVSRICSTLLYIRRSEDCS